MHNVIIQFWSKSYITRDLSKQFKDQYNIQKEFNYVVQSSLDTGCTEKKETEHIVIFKRPM